MGDNLFDEVIPPAPEGDGVHYFDKTTKTWVATVLDDHGFPATPERIEVTRPSEDHVFDEEVGAWKFPSPNPGNEYFENGALKKVAQWNFELKDWELISVSPFPSWIESPDGWTAPVPYPNTTEPHIWWEPELKWVHDPNQIPFGRAVWDSETKDFVDLKDNLKFQLVDGDASWDEQQWPSWTQGEDGRWRAPLPYPNDGNLSYEWDEIAQEWHARRPLLTPDMLPPMDPQTGLPINEAHPS